MTPVVKVDANVNLYHLMLEQVSNVWLTLLVTLADEGGCWLQLIFLINITASSVVMEASVVEGLN